jgi:hypothetical protein
MRSMIVYRRHTALPKYINYTGATNSNVILAAAALQTATMFSPGWPALSTMLAPPARAAQAQSVRLLKVNIKQITGSPLKRQAGSQAAPRRVAQIAGSLVTSSGSFPNVFTSSGLLPDANSAFTAAASPSTAAVCSGVLPADMREYMGVKKATNERRCRSA